jgi:hypothetical protein
VRVAVSGEQPTWVIQPPANNAIHPNRCDLIERATMNSLLTKKTPQLEPDRGS